MLKTRVLTAILLIAFFLIVILFGSRLVFACVSIAVVLLAAFEWCRLAGFKTRWGQIVAFFSLPLIAVTLFSLMSFLSVNTISNFEKIKFTVAYVILAFWILASVAVSLYPKAQFLYQSKMVNLFVGLFILLPTWASAFALFNVSPAWLLYPVILVCLADSSAYFVGKKWGKHLLAPSISPGKTWEGVMGALFSTLIVSIIGYFLFEINISFIPWMLLSVITVLFSVVGDLFESIYKRQQNLKDSGTLLPGHGGVLDRIDAMTAALPVFTIGLMSFLY